MTPAKYSPVTERTVLDLAALVGKSNVAVDMEKRIAYSYDEVPRFSWDREYIAEAVVFPETTEHVSAVLEYADRHRIPVTPRGAGTGLSGGAVPFAGGIVLSFEKMRRILELDKKNLTITVEPGVVTAEITKAARQEGLLYAGDPCSGDASFIGGNVAENAGGNKVVKYGTTGNSVLALEAVLPDGTVTWFGGKRRKDATGYDFAHLIVGSEGTLAVVTKIILKLLPQPGKVVDLLVPFPDVASAIDFAPRIQSEGKVIPSSIEFMDGKSIRLAERFLNTILPYDDAGAHLVIQLEGNDPNVLADDMERIGDLCLASGALEVFVADNKTTSDKLWKARKCLAEAIMAFYPKYSLEDLVVPTSEIPKLMAETTRLCGKYGIEEANFGHVGDGNMHVNLLFPEERPDWHDIIDALLDELYDFTASIGGTLSGEHGIGLKRQKYMCRVMDGAQMELIRRVKLAFDPNEILNPGKMISCPGRGE